MYNKFVGSNKDVFKTRAFRISIFLPVIIAVTFAVAIHYNQTFNGFLSYLWKEMKLPLAIASLTIPFTTWTIANHRSSQMIKTINSQEEKRLYESYFEQEAFFERVFGRCISNSKWEYIVIEDLPVIHSRIYEFNKLKLKKEISICSNVESEVDKYFSESRKAFWEFYPLFTEEISKKDSNEYRLNQLVDNLFLYLHHQLMTATIHLGTRFIDKNEITLPMLCIAYFEIQYLMEHFDIKENITNEELSENSETFNAVIRIVSEFYGIEDKKLNLNEIKSKIEQNMMVKHAVRSPLVYGVDSMMEKLSESYDNAFDEIKIYPKSGDFVSFSMFVGEDLTSTVDVFFTQSTDGDSEGKITAQYQDKKVSIDIYKVDTSYHMGLNENDGELFYMNVGELVISYLDEKTSSKVVI